MAIEVDVRLGLIKGANPQADQLTTMSMSTSTPVYEGSILYEDSSATPDVLQLSTLNTDGSEHSAEFLLLERITADGPTMLERLFRVDVGEKKSQRNAAVLLLRPGMEFETKVFATSGTGALSAGTALETALSVIDGELVIEQASNNDGSGEIARLKENRMGSDGFIRVHVTAVGVGRHVGA